MNKLSKHKRGISNVENTVRLEFKLNQSINDKILTRIFSEVEKSFVDNLAELASFEKTYDYDYNLNTLKNRVKIIESIIRPVIFLTNWAPTTINSRGCTFFSENIFKIYSNVFDGDDTVGYLAFFKEYKEFYSYIIQYHPSSVSFVHFQKYTLGFINKYFTYSLAKVFKDNFHDARKHLRVRSLQFLSSINMSKRGCNILLPEQITRSVVDTIQLLATEPKRLLNKSDFFIRLSSRLIFKKRDAIDLMKNVEPPTKKATYETKTVDGGGYSFLDSTDLFPVDQKSFSEKLYSEENESAPYARIALLLEANKVRFLTIQGTEHQTKAIVIKNLMNEDWGNSRYSTQSEDWLLRFNRYDEIKNTNFKFNHSIDYSAATDGMNPRISRVIQEEIAKIYNLSDIDKQTIQGVIGHRMLDLNKIVLTNHPDPEQSKKIVKNIRKLVATEAVEKQVRGYMSNDFYNPKLHQGVVQNNGQLMGNPLSFPMLCVANLATFLETEFGHQFEKDIENFATIHGSNLSFPLSEDNELYSAFATQYLQKYIKRVHQLHKRETYNKLNYLCINGDDAYLPVEDLEYVSRHKSVSDSYGLMVNQKSITSDLHKGIKQMNSVVFIKDKRIDYLNLSIFCNNNIKNLGSLTKDNFADCVKTFDWNPRVQEDFIYKWVHKICPAVSMNKLWVSKDLGGLGLYWLKPDNLSRKDIFNIISNLHLKNNLNRKFAPPKDEQGEMIHESEFCLSLAKKILAKALQDKKIIVDNLSNLQHLPKYKSIHHVDDYQNFSSILWNMRRYDDVIQDISLKVWHEYRFTRIDFHTYQCVIDPLYKMGVVNNLPIIREPVYPNFESDLVNFTNDLYVSSINNFNFDF
jgi:hypothetical protein